MDVLACSACRGGGLAFGLVVEVESGRALEVSRDEVSVRAREARALCDALVELDCGLEEVRFLRCFVPFHIFEVLQLFPLAIEQTSL